MHEQQQTSPKTPDPPAKKTKPPSKHEVRSAIFVCAGRRWRVSIQKPTIAVRELAKDGTPLAYAVANVLDDWHTFRDMQVCYEPPEGWIAALRACIREMVGLQPRPPARAGAPAAAPVQLRLIPMDPPPQAVIEKAIAEIRSAS